MVTRQTRRGHATEGPSDPAVVVLCCRGEGFGRMLYYSPRLLTWAPTCIRVVGSVHQASQRQVLQIAVGDVFIESEARACGLEDTHGCSNRTRKATQHGEPSGMSTTGNMCVTLRIASASSKVVTAQASVCGQSQRMARKHGDFVPRPDKSFGFSNRFRGPGIRCPRAPDCKGPLRPNSVETDANPSCKGVPSRRSHDRRSCLLKRVISSFIPGESPPSSLIL